METTGDRIRRVRTMKSLTTREFAKRVSVTGPSVTRWESGENNPSEQTLRLICSEFDINYEWLTTGEGDLHSSAKKTMLSALADKYKMTEEEVAVLDKYLALDPKERKSIQLFLQALINPNDKKNG